MPDAWIEPAENPASEAALWRMVSIRGGRTTSASFRSYDEAHAALEAFLAGEGGSGVAAGLKDTIDILEGIS